MVQSTINDSALVEILFDVFRKYGYEGTSIAQLSEATGLKKSSLYHRFPNGKADMAKAVVCHVGTLLADYLVSPLLDDQTSPEKRFNDMLVTVKGFYSEGSKNCLLNVLSLGNAENEIKTLLNESYNHWLAALTKLAIDAGMSPKTAKEKAEHFLIVVEGALVIQRLTNNPEKFGNSLNYEKKQFFS
jgi:TetR/AcrR family transcriptional regulator, lmrAB and yxaGH operons repressor